ncbi:serine hydrolase [Acidocella aquatica]|uniref:serine hydrolase n=1 Tax=Acidocella aquatica TaxID=1922313 RepID=UPI0024E0C54B|nr:serine hydrolase [Acidocella aquatica]
MKKSLALAGLCLAACVSISPAQARSEHHYRRLSHPAAAPAVDAAATNFGPTAPGVSSIVIDAASGQVIASNGADIPRYPASLTKLMTLDLAFQALRAGSMTLDTQIPVSYHAAAVEPVKLGLQPGSTISVHDAILAMTTMSANDAATALGEYLGGGSEPRCAALMTQRAHALGMAQTQFYNASGLPNPGQVTTARDLAILARDIVVNFPEDQPFFEVQQFNFRGHQVYSNNQMLKSYAGATGMKTGYTDLARHNLVTSASRDGRVLIGVELHEPSWGDTYQQMTALLDNGFGGHVPVTAAQIASRQPAVASPVQHLAAATRPHVPASRPAAAQLASRARQPADGSWVAQLGLFSRVSKARIEAIAARQISGAGFTRIARVERHGKTLWNAQVAGLSLAAAHEACDAMVARGNSCRIIEPRTDHLAMETTNTGDGT